MAEFGYNIAFKINNKTLAGRTQDELSITPTIKESITKDDGGNKRQEVVGHEVTFAAQGRPTVSQETILWNSLSPREAGPRYPSLMRRAQAKCFLAIA